MSCCVWGINGKELETIRERESVVGCNFATEIGCFGKCDGI